jgi:hypothetical protein
MSDAAPNPPAWAESAFMAMLPADRAESESGDLLEEYRDEQLPARGRVGADRWFIRQVIVVFARTYGFWIAAAVALFVVGDIANTRRVAVPGLGGPIVLVVVIFAASLHGGWRTKRMEGGLFAGYATASLLWLFMATWWMTTWYPFILTQQVDPYWIKAWHSRGAPGESFAHWIFIDNAGATIVSGVLLAACGSGFGIAGGLAGAAARRLRRV